MIYSDYDNTKFNVTKPVCLLAQKACSQKIKTKEKNLTLFFGSSSSSPKITPLFYNPLNYNKIYHT